MKTEEQFEMLVSQARGESPPQVDVTDSVLATLAARGGQPVYLSDRPLMWLAGVCSAAAVSAVVLATVMYHASTGPLAELVESISWVMQ